MLKFGALRGIFGVLLKRCAKLEKVLVNSRTLARLKSFSFLVASANECAIGTHCQSSLVIVLGVAYEKYFRIGVRLSPGGRKLGL